MNEPLGPAWAPKKPPPQGDGEPAPKPKRFWWRFLLASFLIVAVSAGTTAAVALLYIDSIAEAIGPENDRLQKRLDNILQKAEEGDPQNFLLVGSDKRAGAEFAEDKGRSDTAMLVRLDPGKDLISMMSIPRDLKVEIPGVGTGRFNEAYFYGGTKLTLRVVKNLTGLPIHHVVNVDFLGFAQGVYAIGCVYTDVDRRYYHSNEGVPPEEQYAEINVQPGYQLMCGKKALDYVRYRHTDTDIVRSARQQDFLSSIRHRIDVKDIVFEQGEDLIDVFTEYTTSDINDGPTLLEILKLVAASRDSTMNEVEFPAELSPTYVYASDAAIEGAVEEFLGEAGDGAAAAAAAKPKKARGGGRKKASGGRAGKKKQKREKPKVEIAKPGSDGLVEAREAGEAEAKIASRRARGHFPIYYPTRLPEGTRFVETNPYEKVVDPYVYNLKDDDGNRHLAYRMVLVAEMSDGTHYFGVQGIRGWSDPPIVEDPSLTKEINGREFDIFLDGDRVKMVAWRRGENVYWIANDLLRTLTNDQIIGMARSAKVLVPKKKPKGGKGRG
ncbi:MAG TPA: LCP family protein [Solirubrobacterales bacterium]|nr:LCP family protein [Solirubrobacterales bacterium]